MEDYQIGNSKSKDQQRRNTNQSIDDKEASKVNEGSA